MKKVIFCFILFLSFSLQAADLSSITIYVKNAPEIKKHEDLESVVKYLMRRYRDDEDIALATLTWIVMNIDYDGYYYQKADKDNKSPRDLSKHIPQQGDIIETRLGVCKDIALLYSEMLKMAKIDSKTIPGCVGPKNNKHACQENPHMWNAVWIDNKWELVDPTYAMGDASVLQNIKTNKHYELSVKKRTRRLSDIYKARNRSVDRSFFMTDPKIMENDHHPGDKRWYLTKNSDRRKKD